MDERIPGPDEIAEMDYIQRREQDLQMDTALLRYCADYLEVDFTSEQCTKLFASMWAIYLDDPDFWFCQPLPRLREAALARAALAAGRGEK